MCKNVTDNNLCTDCYPGYTLNSLKGICEISPPEDSQTSGNTGSSNTGSNTNTNSGSSGTSSGSSGTSNGNRVQQFGNLIFVFNSQGQLIDISPVTGSNSQQSSSSSSTSTLGSSSQSSGSQVVQNYQSNSNTLCSSYIQGICQGCK